MSYTKTRNATPPARSSATLDAERNYYSRYGNLTAAHTPATLTAIDRRKIGASSSVLSSVHAHNAQHIAAQAPAPRAHPRNLTGTAIRRKPVDGEASVAVFIALALYAVLVVLLINTASRPTPVHAVNDTNFGRPLATKSATTEFATAPVAPINTAAPALMPIAAEKSVAPPPLELIATQPAPKAALLPAMAATQKPDVARREKALDLLKKARESQTDALVYRQMLAELVRSYGDTPAGAEALNLLASSEPAKAVTPSSVEARDEAQEPKQADEKTVPHAHYGLGLMD